MNKKIAIVAALVVFLGASLAVGVYLVQQRQEIRSKAAPSTTLTLAPSTLTPADGDTFSVDVNIDTGGNQIQTAELYLSYSGGAILAQSIAPGSFIPGSTVLKQAVSENTAELILLVPFEVNLGTSGVLATLTFTAAGSGSSTISFDSNTQILALNENEKNVLASQPLPVTVTVASTQTTSTPTPTPTEAGGEGGVVLPTSTPTPTPTPTEAGGRGGLVLPTSTPTPTPTPTSAKNQNSGGGTGSAATPTAMPQNLPVTGATEYTLMLVGLAFSAIFFGVLLF